MQIYVARALDPVIEAALSVSRDFLERPHFYRHVSDDTAQTLSDFRSYTGSHPDWPDSLQRTLIARMALGRFAVSFASIRRAAIALTQTASDRGDFAAGTSLQEETDSFRAAVEPLEGDALDAPAAIESAMLRHAEAVLTSNEVSAAFGIAEVPAGAWPNGGLYSAQMAYLCEGISQTLHVEAEVTQPQLSIVQRAAHHGAVTLEGVLDPSFSRQDEDRVNTVMNAASSWAAALGDLLTGLDIVRAWKDREYRRGLLPLQRDLIPPHPAGEIDLEGMTPWLQSRRFGLSVSTETVQHEVCCCSGQLCNGTPDDESPTLTMPPIPVPAPPQPIPN